MMRFLKSTDIFSPVRAVALAAVLTLTLACGCSVLNWNGNEDGDGTKSSENDSSPTGDDDDVDTLLDGASGNKKKFRWDGGGVVLGEADHLAFTDDEFIQAVGDLIGEQRFRSAQNLIVRYPDMALTALSSEGNRATSGQALGLIADVFDAQWTNRTSNFCRDFVAWTGPDHDRWFEGKNKFVQFLERDQPGDALALRLDKLLPKKPLPLVDIECRRLQSIAQLMSQRNDIAIQQLSQAVAIADQSSPYLSSQLRLLLGEFYRHSGNIERWRQTWSQAVLDHAKLLGNQRLLDPVFWTRATYLHPANVPWPDAMTAPLIQYVTNQGLVTSTASLADENPEAIIWLAIGAMHLDRDEGQNAVLALKKSEALFTHLKLQTELQLHEARAMIAAGQPGAASAILIRLISESPDLVLQDRAKAVLGAIKLQNGAVAQGLNLLKQSLESSNRWPARDRLRAQADYSLALLIRGREDEGIALLDQVAEEFEACQEPEQAFQCRWNKAKFYEKTSQETKRLAAADRLRDFETATLSR